jgi:hypothetical protein
MAELQEALAIEPGEPELNRSKISDPEDIVRTCGSLVIHKKYSDKVEFSHELVRKFIDGHQSELTFKESDIALRCLVCFSFPRIIFGPPMQWNKFALKYYVLEFWAEHVRNTKGERSVEVDMAVFEAFASPLETRRKTIQGLKDMAQLLSMNFINIVREARVEFIYNEPLPDERIAAW